LSALELTLCAEDEHSSSSPSKSLKNGFTFKFHYKGVFVVGQTIPTVTSKTAKETHIGLEFTRRSHNLIDGGEHRSTSKVKVIPAQPAFPACWADRGQGGQQREIGRRQHRKQTEGHRPHEKHGERVQNTSLYLK
jgi:hypothetical protein